MQILRNYISPWRKPKPSIQSDFSEFKNRCIHHFIQPFQPSLSVPVLHLPFTSQVNIPTNKRSPHYKTIHKIGGEFHPSVIAAIGYNRTWPIAPRYGTHKYGGFQMKSLEVEALIKNILSPITNEQRKNAQTHPHYVLLVPTHCRNISSHSRKK